MSREKALEQLRASYANRPKRASPPAKPYKSAVIDMFRHFTLITSRAVYGANCVDPKGVEYILEPKTEDEALGKYARAALAASRFIKPDNPEFKEVMRFMTSEEEAEYHQKLLDIAGVKTLRTLYSGSKYVSVDQRSHIISLKPWRRKGYGGWEGIRGPDPIKVPETATDLELGQAIRNALAESY